MIVQGMKGLGDNIYQRAFIRQLGHVQLETPWPELYEDLPGVSFLKMSTPLRTQAKNLARQPAYRWSSPEGGASFRVHYGKEGIFPGMERCFGIKPGVMDLPDFGTPLVSGRYALVRPVTLRREWPAAARNPLPEYVAEAAAALRECGITVVSVADLVAGEEEPVGDLPEADVVCHRGELSVKELLGLVQGAAVVVGGIGWLLPAAIAAGVHGWFICGGQGGYNAPSNLTHESMNLNRVHFAVPDHFCMCTQREHSCDKRIAGHRSQFGRWLRETGVVA